MFFRYACDSQYEILYYSKVGRTNLGIPFCVPLQYRSRCLALCGFLGLLFEAKNDRFSRVIWQNPYFVLFFRISGLEN